MERRKTRFRRRTAPPDPQGREEVQPAQEVISEWSRCTPPINLAHVSPLPEFTTRLIRIGGGNSQIRASYSLLTIISRFSCDYDRVQDRFMDIRVIIRDSVSPYYR